jgi:hypothetical protein
VKRRAAALRLFEQRKLSGVEVFKEALTAAGSMYATRCRRRQSLRRRAVYTSRHR